MPNERSKRAEIICLIIRELWGIRHDNGTDEFRSSFSFSTFTELNSTEFNFMSHLVHLL